MRYTRHTRLPEIGVAGQEKLRRAHVLLVGAGGLGCPAALYLAAAGVGRLTIYDDDVVELSNLQRQVLFTLDDLGGKKAEAAKKRLWAFNPDTEVVARAERFTEAVGVTDADIVIDGSDNFATKYLLADAATKYGKPLVHGAVFRFEGRAALFDARTGPCYRCFHPEAPEQAVESCAEAGVLGALCGMVGAAQAMLATKAILGEDACGTLMLFDGLSLRTLRVPRRDGCMCARPDRISFGLIQVHKR
jgi:adenylyltransferase/sulfurtransferase